MPGRAQVGPGTQGAEGASASGQAGSGCRGMKVPGTGCLNLRLGVLRDITPPSSHSLCLLVSLLHIEDWGWGSNVGALPLRREMVLA